MPDTESGIWQHFNTLGNWRARNHSGAVDAFMEAKLRGKKAGDSDPDDDV